MYDFIVPGGFVKRAGIVLIVAVFFVSSMVPASYAGQNVLTIGLIPEMNVFKQMERYRALGDYLKEKTGMEVNFTVLSKYGDIIDKFVEHKLDGAFFGSFTGALAITKLDVVPLARPVNPDGSTTYKGFIFVKKAGGIRSVADMKGKRIAFVDMATTAGYVFPLAYFKENGAMNIEKFFGEYYFAGSHDAAVYAVLNGEADIGAAKDTIFELLKGKDPRVGKELAIIAESPPVPSNTLCVRRDLGQETINKLKSALIAMGRERRAEKALKKLYAVGFVETDQKDYEAVFEIVKKAGIDLKNYKSGAKR